jgi:hypothetical protein
MAKKKGPVPQKPAASLQAAENRALAGENASQDSQLVFQRLYHEHGIGLVSMLESIGPLC